jgi:hypothetical protein
MNGMSDDIFIRVRNENGPVMVARVIRASINKINLKLPSGLIISCYKWNGKPYGGHSCHYVIQDDLEVLKSVPIKYNDNKSVKGSLRRKSPGIPGDWGV